MKIGDSSSKSTPSIEKRDPPKPKTEPVSIPKTNKMETKVQADLKRDVFISSTPAKLNLGQPTSAPVAALSTQSTTATQATEQVNNNLPVRPDVQKDIDDIQQYPPSVQAQVLADHLQAHGTDSADDVAYRQQMLQTLGADQVGEMLKNAPQVDGIYSRGNDISTVLASASSVFSPAEQGQLAQQLGPEQMSRLVAQNAYTAGDPTQDPAYTAQIRQQMDGVAKFLGTVYDLPAGSPGKAEVTGALDRLKSGQEEMLNGLPGEEAAAWIVSRSGSDTMKLDFAQQYLDAFKQDPSSLSPTEARSVAMVLGSLDSHEAAAGPLVDGLDHDQRKEFLSKLTEASYGSTPEWETPANFREDVVKGVNDFLTDVATINPALMKNPAEASDFRVQTFRAATEAIDNDLFQDNQGTKDALANMFAADTAGIVHELANTKSQNADTEGKDLAKFFDHVAFQNEGGSRQWVVDAMQNYLGTNGNANGVANVLAANKGDPQFMSDQGNVMARDMGFLLGALHQGAGSALKSIDDEAARQKAVVDIIGSIAESAIESSPVAKAYEAIKKGTGGQADVKKVFDWLSETYVQGPADASKAAVSKLADSVISSTWGSFFGDDSLNGARSEDLVNLYALINAGVALGDGETQASLKIGG
jgi:hypothetical protein